MDVCSTPIAESFAFADRWDATAAAKGIVDGFRTTRLGRFLSRDGGTSSSREEGPQDVVSERFQPMEKWDSNPRASWFEEAGCSPEREASKPRIGHIAARPWRTSRVCSGRANSKEGRFSLKLLCFFRSAIDRASTILSRRITSYPMGLRPTRSGTEVPSRINTTPTQKDDAAEVPLVVLQTSNARFVIPAESAG